MGDRRLLLNYVIRAQGANQAAWRHPDSSDVRESTTLDYYLEQARLAESGKFDTLFLTDILAQSSVADDALQWPLDPLMLMSALAGVTTSVGLIATHSTTFGTPFNTARQFASLDHLSAGRAGWNVVTSTLNTAAQNFGLAEIEEHDDRYARAAEYLDAAIQLWGAWDPDAVSADPRREELVRTAGISAINHAGAHYRVRGPLNSPRTPQSVPILAQAGESPAGRQLAGRYADLVYARHATLDEARAYRADLRRIARETGRDPDGLRVLPGLIPYVRSTEREARALYNELIELGRPEARLDEVAAALDVALDSADLATVVPPDLIVRAAQIWARNQIEQTLAQTTEPGRATWRDLVLAVTSRYQHRVIVGPPEKVADYLEEGFATEAFDGVSIVPAVVSRSLEDFVELVVPILQERGVTQRDYGPGTLRERLGLRTDFDAARASWTPHYAAQT